MLVFESKAAGPDPRDKETALARRTMHVQVVYPPSLAGHFQIRLADWGGGASASLSAIATPNSNSNNSNSDSNNINFCPLYRLKAPADLFACKTPLDDDDDDDDEGEGESTPITSSEFRLPTAIDEIISKNGSVDAEVGHSDEMMMMMMMMMMMITHRGPATAVTADD